MREDPESINFSLRLTGVSPTNLETYQTFWMKERDDEIKKIFAKNLY
jgi:hypothetical protein